jgi:mono/diheme cytochrome c family protein
MREKLPYLSHFLALLRLAALSLGLVACGQSASPPTEPALDRLAATPLPTLNFKQPTTMIQTGSPEATEESAALPTTDASLARGKGVYTNKGCDSCHGSKGEGVAGKGNGLAGIALTEAEFTDILRTGGKGTLGNEHLYGTQAISPSGMMALYSYIKSFSTP